ncbi:hypothetical protein AVEN_46443-1, partial [Araneus ventricosus]
MSSDSILLEQSKVEGSSTLSEAKATKRQHNSEIRRLPSGAEDDSKKRGNSPLPETRPAKRQKNSIIKNYTSVTGNDSLSITPNELEFEIKKARFEIFNHFMNMKIKTDNDDKVMTKEMKIWTRGGFANISAGKSPQNEFFIKSLINNFEEIIGNIGQESKKDVNHTMDDIRKILVKLVIRIERGFRPRPYIDAVKVARRDAVNFLWIGLWSLAVVLIGVFPDYPHKFFESAVAFYQSTILIFFLFGEEVYLAFSMAKIMILFSFLLGTVLLAVHASPSAHSQSDEFTWAPLCPTSSFGKIPRLIPDPSNCRSAFVCSEGKPLRYFCPRGLVFQATEQECVPRKACTK